VATFFNLTLQILPLQKQKNRAIAGAACVNRDQVLGGGCDQGIADMNDREVSREWLAGAV
jgi:hypothetical protein